MKTLLLMALITLSASAGIDCPLRDKPVKLFPAGCYVQIERGVWLDIEAYDFRQKFEEGFYENKT